jgi:predicted NBD/HSP70 family sugar kinase
MTDALALGLMDFDGKILCDRTERMNMDDIDHVIKRVRHFIDTSIAKRKLDRSRLLGVGIAITGYFIGEGHKVNPPAQLDNWALINVVELFEKTLGLPVWLDNDGNVAAVGECLTGVGMDFPSFAYLFFSVGFGGGVVLNRTLYRGAHGNAGEFGSILPDDVMSPNLESLRERVNQKGKTFETLGAMLEEFNPEWPGVEEWTKPAVKSLNFVISAISAVTDLNAIVFGGRIPKTLAERLIPRLAYFNPSRRAHHRPVPKLMVSSVRHDAAMVGAAALPLKALFYG